MPLKSRQRRFGVREMLDKKFPASVVVPCRELGVVPTGVDTVDAATGVGGIPEGRFVILHGASSCGKTTLLLALAKMVQTRGGIVIYCDFEAKLDLRWAKTIGVDVDDEDSFILRNPRHIEEMFELFDAAAQVIRATNVQVPILLVVDSLQDALARLSHDSTDFNPTGFSPESRVWSYTLKKFKGRCRQYAAMMVGISQLRADPNNPRATKVGVGNEMVHAASVVVQFRTHRERGGLSAAEYEEGSVVVSKNQVASPWGSGDYRIKRGVGIDLAHATVTAAHDLGMLDQAGSWFSVDVGEEKPMKVQGLEKLYALADENPSAFEKIRQAVRRKIGGR